MKILSTKFLGVKVIQSKIYKDSRGLFKENYFLNNDSLGIKISQPLRLDSGRADFHLPVGSTKEREDSR